MTRNVKLKNVIKKQLLIKVKTSNWNTVYQQVSSNDSCEQLYFNLIIHKKLKSCTMLGKMFDAFHHCPREHHVTTCNK